MCDEFHVPDITARKNADLPHAPDFTLAQPYDRYTEVDQSTWGTLYARQLDLLPQRACTEFMDGLQALQLSPHRIPTFDELNERLAATTGWALVLAQGRHKMSHLFNQGGCQPFGGLVHQNQIRITHHGAAQGEHLLLTA